MHKQLSLQVRIRDDSRFENFWMEESNAEIVDRLTQASIQSESQMLFIHGEKGSGVSHLLQSTFQKALESNNSALYVPLGEIFDTSPEQFLAELRETPILILDDMECIAGIPEWEMAFFHLFNHCHANRLSLIIGAHQAPSALGIQLMDLISRMQSMLIMRIESLTEESQREALQARANLRGFELDSVVLEYLFAHTSRSTAHLFALLELLDRESLVAKRKITVPFVKSVLLPEEEGR